MIKWDETDWAYILVITGLLLSKRKSSEDKGADQSGELHIKGK